MPASVTNRVPTTDALDLDGLDIESAVLAGLLTVDRERWTQELPQIEDHFAAIGARLPSELRDQLEALEKRLAD